MTAQITSTVILEALQEVAPDIDSNTLDDNTAFRDQCEIDSIDFLNFVLILESKLASKIPEIDYPKLSSLAGCTAYFAAIEEGPATKNDSL